MTLKEVISLLIEIDKQPNATFERIVLRILEKYLKDENKELYPQVRFPEVNFTADAIAKNGIDKFETDTIIEIKFLRLPNYTLLRLILEKTLERTRQIHHAFPMLLIVPSELKKTDKERLLTFIQKQYPDLKFSIWDITSLTPLFNKYAEFVSDLIPRIGDKALKNIVNKSLEFRDWKKEREKLIERLSEALKKDDLTLFLGAGVSASAGLPNWSNLLSQLLVSLISNNLPDDIEVIDTQKATIAETLQGLNSSPLLEARYINSGLNDKFEGEVSSILYQNVEATTTSSLIQAVANLCIPPRGALGIRAIVNYNFDDLIEKSLETLSLKYRPIYRDMDIPLKQELGIFHVHGFLPRTANEYEGITESLLVFSEKNYHTLMQEPYFWSNLIQLNFFRENTCLLIGLSGTDPNLRRLLEIAKKKTKIAKHYILLQRTPNKHFIKDFEDKGIAYSDKLIEAINAIHHSLQEKSFDELGLNIIWYEDHNIELPDIINSINHK